MSLLAIRSDNDAAYLRVVARPGASKSLIHGVHGDALKVAIHAAPEKGKANKELIAFLAKTLGLKRAQVTLSAGQTSRTKTLRFEGLTANDLEARLRDYT
jgi:uncharacterized protein